MNADVRALLASQHARVVLNLLGLLVFAALFAITMRRGTTDPVCGMSADLDSSLRLEHDARSYFFCCEHCRHAFQADPDRYAGAPRPPRAERQLERAR